MANVDNDKQIEDLIHAMNHCRTCKHIQMAHKKTPQNKQFCLNAELQKNGAYKGCNCKLFVPKDNLEFLEWVAEQKKNENLQGR
jgi:hypothetical protein